MFLLHLPYKSKLFFKVNKNNWRNSVFCTYFYRSMNFKDYYKYRIKGSTNLKKMFNSYWDSKSLFIKKNELIVTCKYGRMIFDHSLLKGN